jgi:anti-anti-sigma regulatory factor
METNIFFRFTPNAESYPNPYYGLMKTIYIQQLPATFRKGRTVLLKLEGNLILASGEEVRQLLLAILPDSRSVRIVLQQVEQIDLPFLQLIWSACNTAGSLGKNFRLEGTLSDG